MVANTIIPLLNPAVTVAVVLSRRGKCPVLRVVVFIAIQLLAGFLAGLVVAGVHDKGPNRSESFCLKPLTHTNAMGKTEDYWLTPLGMSELVRLCGPQQ